MNSLGLSPVFAGSPYAYPKLGVAGAVVPDKVAVPAVPAITAAPLSSAAPASEVATDPDTASQAQQQAQKQLQLSKAEAELLRVTQTELRELSSRDREVRTHEQAHKAVGGQYAGAISYSYERGPDGRLYAVGGSVSIDTAPVPGDPQATLQKLQQVQRAALAPAQPSPQDLAVASQAAQAMAVARAELAAEAMPTAVTEDDQSPATSDQMSSGAESDRGLALYRQVGDNAASAEPAFQVRA